MKKIINIYDQLHWDEANGYPKGTRIKVLRDENGAKTILLKLPKEFHIESHSHVTAEQHFILEGEYESEGQVYGAGSYKLIHAHADHGPFTSKNGALVLVVYDPT